MTKTIRQLLLPAAIVVLALLAPAQATASPLDVQRDCADSDVFERTHSRADLRKAVGQIQADLGEYGTCEQMIRAELARLNQERGGGGGPTAQAADLDGDGVISPEERTVARESGGNGSASGDGDLPPKGQVGLVHDGDGPDGGDDDAGTVAATGGGGSGGSLPLILAVVALACAAIGGGLWYAGKRNPAVGNALRRVPNPFRNS